MKQPGCIACSVPQDAEPDVAITGALAFSKAQSLGTVLELLCDRHRRWVEGSPFIEAYRRAAEEKRKETPS